MFGVKGASGGGKLGYNCAMRRMSSSIVLIASLSLVFLQLSGLHMHVNSGGYSGAPHGTHVHDGDTDGHDHEHDADVSVVELGAGGFKFVMFLMSLGLILLMILRPSERAFISLVETLPTGRRSRWRPPLRAPPSRFSLSH